MKKRNSKIVKGSLAQRVIALIEESRRKTAAVANLALVYTYYEIGRQIVEEEQGGSRRAGYGDAVLLDLSNKLTDRFGAGWSVETLTKCRYFFVTYSATKIVHTVDDFCLSWSQYKTVLPSATAFKRIIRQEQIAYEKEKLLALAAKKGGR